MASSQGDGRTRQSPGSLNYISRRSFLKTASISVAGAAVGTVVMSSGLAHSAPALGIDDVSSIAADSVLWPIAIERGVMALSVQKVNAYSFEVAAKNNYLMALWMRDIQAVDNSVNTSALCTVDLSKRVLTSIQLLITSSFAVSLEVRSIVITDTSLHPQLFYSRDSAIKLPGFAQEVIWSFPRDPRDVLSSEPSLQSFNPRSYKPVRPTAVILENGQKPCLLAGNAVEVRTTDPTDIRSFPLSYPVAEENLQPQT